MRTLGLTVLSIVVGCSSPVGGSSGGACQSSLDCPGNQDCLDGACVLGPGTPPGRAPSDASDGDSGAAGPDSGPTGPFTPPPTCQKDADCIDNDPCTDDLCAAGTCVYPTQAVGACQCEDTETCDDGNDCTDQVCSGKLCKYALTPGPGCCGADADCDDGIPSTTDFCDVFRCVNEQGGCESVAECDDGDPCTIDACSGGECAHTPNPQCCVKNVDCDDGNSCTTDSCSNNLCAHAVKPGCCTVDGDCNDGNSCTVDACQGGACKYSPAPGCCAADAECDDGDFCTADACSNFKCTHTPVAACCQKDADCDDGNPCTDSQCQGGNCIDSPKIGCCQQPTDCNDGDMCTQDVCVEQACVYNAIGGPGCNADCEPDSYEPNETFPGKSVGEIGDCADAQDAPPATIQSTGDVDWYSYTITDKLGCDVQPEVVVTGTVPGTELTACAFYTCENGDDADIDCIEDGTTKDESLGKKTHGCCGTVIGTADLKIRISPSCSFLGLGSESGKVDIQVKPNIGTSCVAYSFTWGDS